MVKSIIEVTFRYGQEAVVRQVSGMCGNEKEGFEFISSLADEIGEEWNKKHTQAVRKYEVTDGLYIREQRGNIQYVQVKEGVASYITHSAAVKLATEMKLVITKFTVEDIYNQNDGRPDF